MEIWRKEDELVEKILRENYFLKFMQFLFIDMQSTVKDEELQLRKNANKKFVSKIKK